jgi:hypothetical protein
MTREQMQKAWVKIVETGFSNYDMLSQDQKIWFNVEQLTTGGIIDHYINNGAEHNLDTIHALEYLGFSDIAELLRKINQFFINAQPPSDLIKRNEQWDSWSDKHESLLDEIDVQFWIRNEALENALMQHIIKSGIGRD